MPLTLNILEERSYMTALPVSDYIILDVCSTFPRDAQVGVLYTATIDGLILIQTFFILDNRLLVVYSNSNDSIEIAVPAK